MDQVHGRDDHREEPTFYPGLGYVCPKTTCSWFGKSLTDFEVWALKLNSYVFILT